ncbi:MAG: GTPase HflX [Desulfobacterales bacterium]|jgi:GTP-binding protein HflX|nr:GTPase HflX [Desulfobacterales bacterium]
MKRLHGNTIGLKANQLHRLENLYRRRIPPQFVITPELCRDLAALSHETGRQMGLLVNRRGHVEFVIVGDAHGIVIPDTQSYRSAPGRLRGLRCIHTHLKETEGVSRDDLTDLSLLRLDLMAVVTVAGDGLAREIWVAHLIPSASEEAPYEILPPISPHHPEMDCLEMILALEREIGRSAGSIHYTESGIERALLVGVAIGPKQAALDSLNELKALSRSCGIEVVGTRLQQRSRADARYLLGSGKLQELSIVAQQAGVSLLVFDQELNPSQIRAITDLIDLKVIDRTQLILDIFAQRARTRDGKRQVELAQLRYLLPRLIAKNTAMSRLTGGIGGRGPGETKLEINRRRVRERITRLEKDLALVRKQRAQQRARRDRKQIPVISIIGYTNAGKSTLLNTLTHSHMLAESRLFATLDTASRRLRFPRDTEVIITDTVGFIRDLPKELMAAFRATLEELESADLLLHVVDVSSPHFEAHMDSVEKVLIELNLNRMPCLCAFNKQDRVAPELLAGLKGRLDGVFISARDPETLRPLIEEMEQLVNRCKPD